MEGASGSCRAFAASISTASAPAPATSTSATFGLGSVSIARKRRRTSIVTLGRFVRASHRTVNSIIIIYLLIQTSVPSHDGLHRPWISEPINCYKCHTRPSPLSHSPPT